MCTLRILKSRDFFLMVGGFPTDFCGSTLLILIYSVNFLAFKSIIFYSPSGQKQTFSQDCERCPSQDCEGCPSFLHYFSSASFNRIFLLLDFRSISGMHRHVCHLFCFSPMLMQTPALNNYCFDVLYWEWKEIIYNWLFSLSVWRFPFPSSKSKLQAESEVKVCS